VERIIVAVAVALTILIVGAMECCSAFLKVLPELCVR
jgi:hypothetical protein